MRTTKLLQCVLPGAETKEVTNSGADAQKEAHRSSGMDLFARKVATSPVFSFERAAADLKAALKRADSLSV
jgi:hypothetical protein